MTEENKKSITGIIVNVILDGIECYSIEQAGDEKYNREDHTKIKKEQDKERE